MPLNNCADAQWSFSAWDEFDDAEYRSRNYGEQILSEDEGLISACLRAFAELGVNDRQFSNYIDVGTGPNLYPSLLMTPYVKEDGRINLLDFAKPNIDYLNKILNVSSEAPEVSEWKRFQELMAKVGGARYNNALANLLSRASVAFGDVYNLPANCCDAISGFFLAESITDSFDQFKLATSKLIEALRPGGVLVTGHMLGSSGWYAGLQTSFPAISLSLQDLMDAYTELPGALVNAVDHLGAQACRHGYSGMALVVGVKGEG